MAEVRLIDADALHKMLEEVHDETRRIYSSLVDYRDKEVCKGELGTYARVKRMVDEAPTISPDSLRPKGKWIVIDDDYQYNWDVDDEIYVVLECECSACKQRARGETNFCPNCGADMREV